MAEARRQTSYSVTTTAGTSGASFVPAEVVLPRFFVLRRHRGQAPRPGLGIAGSESVRLDHRVIYVVTFRSGCLHSQLDAGPPTFIEESPSTRSSRCFTLIDVHASFIGQVVLWRASCLVECEEVKGRNHKEMLGVHTDAEAVGAGTPCSAIVDLK